MTVAGTIDPPRALRGFDGVRRYWDQNEHSWVAQVVPGDFYVTREDEIISTVLGSCVSTCVRDPMVGIGGLNHFMLPQNNAQMRPQDALRYGGYAIERLLNELIKYGARREHLEIKVFGGGKVIAGSADIGNQNIQFAHAYFDTEGLPIAAEDTGGGWARRVRYYPASGVALIKRLPMQEAPEVVQEEEDLNERLSELPPGGSVDLWD